MGVLTRDTATEYKRTNQSGLFRFSATATQLATHLCNFPTVSQMATIIQLQARNGNTLCDPPLQLRSDLDKAQSLSLVANVENLQIDDTLDTVRGEFQGATRLVGQIKEDQAFRGWRKNLRRFRANHVWTLLGLLLWL